jgi:hypothetical protein
MHVGHSFLASNVSLIKFTLIDSGFRRIIVRVNYDPPLTQHPLAHLSDRACCFVNQQFYDSMDSNLYSKVSLFEFTL